MLNPASNKAALVPFRLRTPFRFVPAAKVCTTVPKVSTVPPRHIAIRPEECARRGFDSGLPDAADVVIIGGGVTGSALLYELADFTDVSRVLLIERREDFARVASGPNNNSQTIHCGDIETNYTPQKAALVQRQANMLRNFATKLPSAEKDRTIAKMQKMAIGVGDKECEFMVDRFKKFKPVFKRLELYDKKQVEAVEPGVIYESMGSRRARPENIVANFVADEYSAVDYYHLTRNFINKAKEIGINRNREIMAIQNCEMWDIQRLETDRWRVWTNKGAVDAKFVVVAGCGYSLLAAHRLGYAKHLSCMPVAGSFYFGPTILRGKVYTVQNPKLPFAALHGDPDMVAGRKTRFGPTALPLPLLERYRWKTFWDFLEVLRPSSGLVRVYWDLFKDTTIRNYLLKNFAFEVPYVNKRLFLKDIRKVVPSLELSDLSYAHNFGGVRPQIVDTKEGKLLLGEGKISPDEDPIIFNVTPSPGGTTCLGNAEIDLRKIAKHLSISIDEPKLKEALLEGEYPVDQ